METSKKMGKREIEVRRRAGSGRARRERLRPGDPPRGSDVILFLDALGWQHRSEGGSRRRGRARLGFG